MAGGTEGSAVSHRVLFLDETTSTNAEALRLGAAGEDGGLWVIADRQTAGRGRSGRSWTSEAGNLHASLLLRFPAPLPLVYQLSLVAGVAVSDAIRAAAILTGSDRLRLKWPNDILVGARKTGGILVESRSAGAEVLSVVGIGINLVSHPVGLEGAATHLAAHGTAPTREAMLEALSAAMARSLAVWNRGAGFPAVRSAWLERAGPLGERVQVHRGTGAGISSGRFAGLAEDGALLVADEAGKMEAVSFGDVTLEGQ